MKSKPPGRQGTFLVWITKAFNLEWLLNLWERRQEDKEPFKKAFKCRVWVKVSQLVPFECYVWLVHASLIHHLCINWEEILSSLTLVIVTNKQDAETFLITHILWFRLSAMNMQIGCQPERNGLPSSSTMIETHASDKLFLVCDYFSLLPSRSGTKPSNSLLTCCQALPTPTPAQSNVPQKVAH